jgi:hypothetical protein
LDISWDAFGAVISVCGLEVATRSNAVDGFAGAVIVCGVMFVPLYFYMSIDWGPFIRAVKK